MVNNYQVLKEEEIEITIDSVLFNKIHVQPNHLTNFILLVIMQETIVTVVHIIKNGMVSIKII